MVTFRKPHSSFQRTDPSFTHRFHNPTAVSLSDTRAEKLLALAEQYDFMVVFDNPYSLLPFVSDRPPPSPMRMHPRAINMGSFSKILAPGLRLGWLVAHQNAIDRYMKDGAYDSGGGPPNVMTECVRVLMESGQLRQHVTFVRNELERRMKALETSLKEVLGRKIVCHVAQGGYFVCECPICGCSDANVICMCEVWCVCSVCELVRRTGAQRENRKDVFAEKFECHVARWDFFARVSEQDSTLCFSRFFVLLFEWRKYLQGG